MNITQATKDVVMEMVHECFVANSKVDRMQSILNAKFAYVNTANLIHHDIAHAYSGTFGDGIAETIEKYNVPIEYGNIPYAVEDYETVENVIQALLDLVIDFQNKLNKCAKETLDNMDLHVYAELLDIIEEHNPIVEQVILLQDKIKLYQNNPAFDVHIDHFWFLGEKGEER